MTRFICFLFAIVAAIPTATAQVLEKGPVYEAQRQSFKPNIVGEDENNIYIVDVRPGESGPYSLTVESFSKNTLERNYTKEVIVDYGTDSYWREGKKFESLTFLDGNFVYLMQFIHISKKDDEGDREYRTELHAHVIDGETGEVQPMDTLVINTTDDLPSDGESRMWYRNADWRIRTSKNDKRLIAVYSSYFYDLKKTFQWVYVFDSEMKLLKEQLVIPEEAEDVIPKQITIDDEGSLYYLDNGDLVLLDYYQDYEKWREPFPTDIFESNADGSNLSGTFNDDGDLILTASYVTTDLEDTDENKERSETREGDTQLEGVIYLKINTLDKEVDFVTVSRFDQDFIDEFLDEDLIDDELDAEVNNVFNRFQYDFNEDATYVVGEALDRGNYGLKAFGDIVVYSFNNENGELNWAHRVPRLQIPDKELSVHGVMTFFDQDYVYILFQDEEDNFDETGKRNIMDLEELDHDIHAVAVLYRFNKETGEMNYSMQPDWNSGKYFKINPNYSITAKEGIFVFMQDRDQYQLARIKFEEE